MEEDKFEEKDYNLMIFILYLIIAILIGGYIVRTIL